MAENQEKTPITRQMIEKIIDEKMAKLENTDRYTFQKKIQIFDGRNIQLGKNTGTMLGTEASQKIGLYGINPTPQQNKVTTLAGVITALETLGITAS